MSLVQFSIRVAWSLAVATVAGAIITILHVLDIHPERRLAFAVLGVIADSEKLEVLQWTAVAVAAVIAATVYNLIAWRISKKRSAPTRQQPKASSSDAYTPRLLILHDKLQDTEPWPGSDGYNAKFRVLNDSEKLAQGVGARIRTLEFLQGGQWRPYGHDYAEVPLATRDGKDKFDLPGGDENSVYIARRSTRPGESIQLCYAKKGVPNTIPLKPAWRVCIRLVSDNALPKDAIFQLRINKDESLVGILLSGEAEDELTRRKRRADYVSGIYADAVDLRNNVFTLRVLDANSSTRMDELQDQLLVEISDLAPERAITLKTINTYSESDHPRCLLQDTGRRRAMVVSEFLRRVMKILEDYK